MVKGTLKNLIKKLILEAYVDQSGQLQDFNAFPYDGEPQGEVSPLYDPELKRGVNRMKAPGGGLVLKLDIEEPYQQKAFRRVLKLAVENGIPMGTGMFKLPKTGAFTFQRIGTTHKYTFNSKYVIIIKTILKQLSKEDSLSPYFDAYSELANKIR
jgi:hypothetical protein